METTIQGLGFRVEGLGLYVLGTHIPLKLPQSHRKHHLTPMLKGPSSLHGPCTVPCQIGIGHPGTMRVLFVLRFIVPLK